MKTLNITLNKDMPQATQLNTLCDSLRNVLKERFKAKKRSFADVRHTLITCDLFKSLNVTDSDPTAWSSKALDNWNSQTFYDRYSVQLLQAKSLRQLHKVIHDIQTERLAALSGRAITQQVLGY